MNPFSKDSKALKERKGLEAEVKKDLSHLRAVANDMLNDGRYRKIKEFYENAERNVIDLLIRQKELSKEKIDEYRTELRIFKTLLQVPQDLSKEKPKPSFNFMNKFFTEVKKDVVGAVVDE